MAPGGGGGLVDYQYVTYEGGTPDNAQDGGEGAILTPNLILFGGGGGGGGQSLYSFHLLP